MGSRRPLRVVSLLPSATESLLTIMGGVRTDRVELVGRSHECDWPDDGTLDGVPILTGQRTRFSSSAEIDRAVRDQLATGESLYTLDTEGLRRLEPDVVLTQDLCPVCSIDLATVEHALTTPLALERERAGRAALPGVGEPDHRGQVSSPSPMPPPDDSLPRGHGRGGSPRVVSLNPTTIEGVFDDLLAIGRAIGMEPEALSATVSLRERVYRAEEFVNPYADGPAIAFLEWTDPIYIGGHWTPQLIERAGARHPLNPTVPDEGSGAAVGPIGQTCRRAGRSVRAPEEVLAASRPEMLIVCPCGLNLDQAWSETHGLAQKPWWRDLPAVRNGRVAVVDGNQMFNRPGPRLVDAFEWLVGWVNGRPERIPAGFPWRCWL